MDEISLKAASKIYNYCYNVFIKDYNHGESDRLAKIPADYVYFSLNKLNTQCFIDNFKKILSEVPFISHEHDINILLENITLTF